MKRKLLIVLLSMVCIVCLAFGLTACNSDNGNNNGGTATKGLEFTLNDEGTGYSVTGIGTLTETDIVIPTKYKNLPVTEIGSYAFSGCKKLTSIIIPDSVTLIGNSAFSGCSSLESITIPFVGGTASATTAESYTLFGYIFGTDSYIGGTSTQQYYKSHSDFWKMYYIPASLRRVVVTGGNILYGAFYNCSSLTSIEIPDSVTSIGDYAFYNCNVTEVVMPTTAIGSIPKTNLQKVILTGGDRIPDNAFSGCIGLTSIEIPDSVTAIGSDAFYGCIGLTSIKIPDGVTTIGSNAFYGCIGLTSIVIPDGVTTIGSNAFYGCIGLTSIVIPDGVTAISENAFAFCSGLRGIEIPDGVTTIGSGAFEYCIGLTGELKIPDSVTSIGLGAFMVCSSLESVTIGSGVTSIGGYAFYSCVGFTSIEIPDGVTSIGSYAFAYCSGLTSVTIGKGVTSIGDRAFWYCSRLTSVVIPDGVTSIGDWAFSDCSRLTSVTIGKGVTSIGNRAFAYCSMLASVTFANPNGWWFSGSSSATSGTGFSSSILTNPATAANYLRSTYSSYYWKRS